MEKGLVYSEGKQDRKRRKDQCIVKESIGQKKKKGLVYSEGKQDRKWSKDYCIVKKSRIENGAKTSVK